jgi:sensor histidine kinase YesM
MFKGRIKRLLLAICVFILIAAPAFAGNPPFAADTARLISWAREARQLLQLPGNQSTADSLLSLAKEVVSKEKMQTPLLLYWALAESAFQRKDYGNAYDMAARAMKSSQSQIGLQSQGELMIFFAKTCQYTGQFNVSVDYLNKTVEFAGFNHLKKLSAKACNALGEVYTVVGDPAKVRESLERMLQFAMQESDSVSTLAALYKLGKQNFGYKYDFHTVDRYMRQSLEYSVPLRDTATIAVALADIAWNFYLEKKLDSSLFYYQACLDYAIPGKRYYSLANALGNMGTIYRDMKKFDKALAYWKKGISTAREHSDWYTQSWIYSDMSKMASDQGNHQDAYKFQVLYKQYSDSLAKQKNSDGLNMARAKYEADASQKQVELLSLKVKNQRLLLYGVGAFLLLSIIIGLLLLRQAKLNAKRRISEMDQKILEVTQANLRQQMNPHFIFNTLNSIQYYMYKHDKLATNNYLTKFSSLMRKILENSQHTAVPIRDEIDALQLYLELESIRFRDKFDYEIIIDEEIDTLMYKIPTMLIQPYVENAICHGLMYREEKGKVKISLMLGKDHVSVVIEDNGIGRDASREISRNKEKTHNSLGTQITESRLKLVSALYGTSLKTHFTDLKDEEGKGTGTRVEIHIPILT